MFQCRSWNSPAYACPCYNCSFQLWGRLGNVVLVLGGRHLLSGYSDPDGLVDTPIHWRAFAANYALEESIAPPGVYDPAGLGDSRDFGAQSTWSPTCICRTTALWALSKGFGPVEAPGTEVIWFHFWSVGSTCFRFELG